LTPAGFAVGSSKMGKVKSARDAVELEQIPNIGPSIADDLRGIGIKRPADLRGKNGFKLYEKLNRKTGMRHDPCVCDTFLAAVDFMNGSKARPWWKFTAERKRAFGEKK